MSFLDLGEQLVGLLENVELVYSPLMDTKEFPEDVDATLIEGAVANLENLELLERIRERSRLVISFGDCAITGNVTSLRNFFPVDDLLTAVYHAGPGSAPHGTDAIKELPPLLPRVLPLHQAVSVDAYIPGCPPEPDRILAALTALVKGEAVQLTESQRTFG
jgi:NAD-reducing hydrogenase small subunit